MTSPVACTISATGISQPSMAAIVAYLTSQYQQIFGTDAYLGNDSQDGQLLNIFANAMNDANNALVQDYNAYSPSTAQGVGLSSVVKINGLTRSGGQNSMASLTLTGTANSQINNGVAQDTNGNLWSLPSPTTIGSGGTVTVTATCQTPGAVTAAANAINIIGTPTSGWQTVTNPSQAVPGYLTQSDASLRQEQSVSTELPSVTITAGILASILQTAGVTRATAIENNTNSTNGDGVPAGNTAYVVEGGTEALIAQAIGLKLPPGGRTYGSTTTTYTDPAGVVRTISYSVATEDTITVNLSINPGSNWSSTTEQYITASIAAYLGSLEIGQTVSWSEVLAAAYNIAANNGAGTYTIAAGANQMTLQLNGGGAVSADLTIAWNAVASVTPTVNYNIL